LIAAAPAASNEEPRYPASARRKGIEGVVVVSFDVLEDGRVANPKIVSGPPELHEIVLKTVMEWRYKAAHRGAKAERQRVTRQIRFRLEDA
jgi:protein TonB